MRDSGLDAVRERADPVILHVALFSQKSLAVRCVSVGHSVDAGERDTLQLDESVTQVLPPGSRCWMCFMTEHIATTRACVDAMK